MSDPTPHRGSLLGLAVGDALGTTVEAYRRGSFEPVTTIVGGGPFDLEPGQWTDDTSMALCLATSLVRREGFDARDQMERYVKWVQEGYLSSTGGFVDVGGTVATALHRFLETGEPFAGETDPQTAGNGCIMRLAPVPMYWWRDHAAAIHWSRESSRTTHGTQECLDACALFGSMLWRALNGAAKEEILFSHEGMAKVGAPASQLSPKIAEIADGLYADKSESQIRGTGYVVECLEAALWCFWNSSSFEEAVLKAVNLGDDADTTAAVCGQIAGAYWGEGAIREEWRECLAMAVEIRQLADQLLESGVSAPSDG